MLDACYTQWAKVYQIMMASGTCVGAGRVHGHGTNAGDEDDLPPHPSTA